MTGVLSLVGVVLLGVALSPWGGVGEDVVIAGALGVIVTGGPAVRAAGDCDCNCDGDGAVVGWLGVGGWGRGGGLGKWKGVTVSNRCATVR